MNINKSISSDLQIVFHKLNKNLKSRSKIIILKISQSLSAKNNTFIHLTNSQMSFSDVEIILLLNLFIKIIIILNSFSREESFKIKLMIII